MSNPYDNPTFATDYTLSQVQPDTNWYEWNVTHPVLSQSIIGARNILDYGCGSGVFTIAIAHDAEKWNATDTASDHAQFTATDASSAMIDIALRINQDAFLTKHPVQFHTWDASQEKSPFSDRKFDRIMAKLSLNYIDPESLSEKVFPHFREHLTDDGLLLFVLPNPLREAQYNLPASSRSSEQTIVAGNFNNLPEVTTYRHSSTWIAKNLSRVGFQSLDIAPLPDVRRESIRRPLSRKREWVLVADPTPLVNELINTAKRLIYIASPEEESIPLQNFLTRYADFIETRFPEVADIRSDIRDMDSAPETVFTNKEQSAYVYRNHTDRNGAVLAASGDYVEHLSGRQKMQFAKKLRLQGIRRGPSL